MLGEIRISICLLCICLSVAAASCSKELSSGETDAPDSEVIHVEEAHEQESMVGESVGGEDIILTEYSEIFEAYLNILDDNRLSLTNAQLSDGQKSIGLDIGDGKIAIVNVYGDETPELLYIYSESENSDNLAIYTYSKEEGATSIFDYNIYTAAGGEGYYCVYITRDGELMTYYARSDAMSYYGFWSIFSAKTFKYEGGTEVMFDYHNLAEAQLYYTDLNSVMEEEYSQYGEVISTEQFGEMGSELIGNIDSVLFQGVAYNGKIWFYEYDLWKDITPFEEDCMSYTEAVAWLEMQIQGKAGDGDSTALSE